MKSSYVIWPCTTCQNLSRQAQHTQGVDEVSLSFLGSSSKAFENLASFSLQYGATGWHYFLTWTTPHLPTAKRFLSVLCSFPTLIVTPINKYVWCPPLSLYVFSVSHTSVLYLSLSWIQREVENMASSSLSAQLSVYLNLYIWVWTPHSWRAFFKPKI